MSAVVRHLPAAGRPAGADEDRAHLDRAGAAAGGLLHEAHCRGWLRDVLDQRGAERCPASSAPARHSPTQRSGSCAMRKTTEDASRRRCAITARRSGRTCFPRSDRCASRTSMLRRSSAGVQRFRRGCHRAQEQAAD